MTASTINPLITAYAAAEPAQEIYMPMPPNLYRATTHGAKYMKSKNKQTPLYDVDCVISDGPFRDYRLQEHGDPDIHGILAKLAE